MFELLTTKLFISRSNLVYRPRLTDRLNAGLAFILGHQPANMHPVINTRVDPALPVSRLRARSQRVEIRAREYSHYR